MANPTAAVPQFIVPATEELIERGLAATVQTYYPNEMIGLDIARNATKFDDTQKLMLDGLVADSVRVEVLTGDAAGDRKVKVTRPRYFSMLIASAVAADIGRPVYARFSNEVQFSQGTYGNLAGYIVERLSSTQVVVKPAYQPDTLHVKVQDSGTTNQAGEAVDLTAGKGNGTAAGGAFLATGGQGGATGAGGAVTLTAGAGGATSGAGAVASLTGGAGTAGNSAGGVAKIVGGAGSGTSAGGAAQVTGGAGGATGTGGAVTLTSGAGGATSGASGAVTVASGTPVDGAGGNITISAAAGVGTNRAGGTLSLTAGAGVGSGAAGTIAVTAGAGGTNTAGGAITITGGAGAGTGNGGALTLTAGASGAGATGNGGAASLVAGAASSTNGNGGDVVLQPGALAGTGATGVVRIAGTAPQPFAKNVVRSTIANAGTITDAQTAGQVLYQDASGGNVTMTTRTGTQLAAYFAGLAVGNAIAIYCASNHAVNTSTIAGGTDVTLVGSGAVTQLGGTFLLIKTAATTFDLVRVG